MSLARCAPPAKHMQARTCKKRELNSVNLLHLRRLVSGPFHFLKRGKVVIVNAQAKFDHAVDASSELCGFIEVETRGEQGGVKEKPNQVFHGFVRFVRGSLLLQL